MIIVEVTAEDIKKGERGFTWGCPIALAAKRKTGLDWSVTRMGMRLYDDDGRLSEYANIPVEAETFIKKFDAGELVLPFSFPISPVKQ